MKKLYAIVNFFNIVDFIRKELEEGWVWIYSPMDWSYKRNQVKIYFEFNYQ